MSRLLHPTTPTQKYLWLCATHHTINFRRAVQQQEYIYIYKEKTFCCGGWWWWFLYVWMCEEILNRAGYGWLFRVVAIYSIAAWCTSLASHIITHNKRCIYAATRCSRARRDEVAPIEGIIYARFVYSGSIASIGVLEIARLGVLCCEATTCRGFVNEVLWVWWYIVWFARRSGFFWLCILK